MASTSCLAASSRVRHLWSSARVACSSLPPGYDIIEGLSKLPTNEKDVPDQLVTIANCGELELRKGRFLSFNVTADSLTLVLLQPRPVSAPSRPRASRVPRPPRRSTGPRSVATTRRKRTARAAARSTARPSRRRSATRPMISRRGRRPRSSRSTRTGSASRSAWKRSGSATTRSGAGSGRSSSRRLKESTSVAERRRARFTRGAGR